MPNGPSGHKEITPGNELTKREPRHGGQERPEPPKPRNQRAEPRNQKPEESPFKPGFKLQFETADSLADLIVPIQSEQFPEGPIDPDKLKQWKQTLVDAGMDRSRVARMSAPEVIVWGQRLIHVSDIEMPDGESPEVKLKRLSIKKAGDLETEEPLTVKKVKEYYPKAERPKVRPSGAIKKPAQKVETEIATVTDTTEELPIIVESYPHLENSPKEQMIEVFSRDGVP